MSSKATIPVVKTPHGKSSKGKTPTSANPTSAETTVLCRFGEKCYRGDNCPYAHPSGKAGPSDNKLQICRFGDKCYRSDCRFAHPSGKTGPSDNKRQICRFGDKCYRNDCRFAHPSGKAGPSDNYAAEIKNLTDRLNTLETEVNAIEGAGNQLYEAVDALLAEVRGGPSQRQIGYGPASTDAASRGEPMCQCGHRRLPSEIRNASTGDIIGHYCLSCKQPIP